MKVGGLIDIEVAPRTIEELVAEERCFDDAVRASADVDVFCSGHAFSVAAFKGLLPGRQARAYRVGDAGWLAFATRTAAMFGDPRPRELWEPFEAMWGLGCPVLGSDHRVLAVALAEVLRRDAPHATVLVCGLRNEGDRLAHLAAALGAHHRVMLGSPTVRVVASLEGGSAAFLSRRSSRFRANLRRALRQVDADRVQHERIVPSEHDVAALYARAAAVDDRSWKGRSDAGLRATGLFDFYADMLPRLARHGALRMHFLVDETAPEGQRDIAYLFGGISGDTFRGLQFAFVEGHESRSLGNVVQYRAIEALSDEGIARYDLGTLVDYKASWGEISDATVSVVAVPRGIS